MEKAIKLAIEGGYKRRDRATNRIMSSKTLCQKWQYVVLEKAFWWYLGENLKWELKYSDVVGGTKYPEWLYQWHRFIDHLAEGKDAEEFFTKLLE